MTEKMNTSFKVQQLITSIHTYNEKRNLTGFCLQVIAWFLTIAKLRQRSTNLDEATFSTAINSKLFSCTFSSLIKKNICVIRTFLVVQNWKHVKFQRFIGSCVFLLYVTIYCDFTYCFYFFIWLYNMIMSETNCFKH